MNETAFAVEKISNGLEIFFFDQGNRYFGDYHQVKVLVSCRIALNDELVADSLSAEDLQQARNLFGDHIEYKRVLKQMGVAGAEVETVRSELVKNFIESTLSYMQANDFSARYVARRLAEHRNRSRMYLVGHD